MLYGFLRFAPRGDGFKLDPRLPKAWPEFTLDQIRFQNLEFKIRAAKNVIEIHKQAQREEPMFLRLMDRKWKATWLREDVSRLKPAEFPQRASDGAFEINWNGAAGIRFETD